MVIGEENGEMKNGSRLSCLIVPHCPSHPHLSASATTMPSNFPAMPLPSGKMSIYGIVIAGGRAKVEGLLFCGGGGGWGGILLGWGRLQEGEGIFHVMPTRPE